jgi:hypothetical protein
MEDTTILRKIEEAGQEWERNREWKRQAPPGSNEWIIYRNRMGALRAKQNKLVNTLKKQRGGVLDGPTLKTILRCFDGAL